MVVLGVWRFFQCRGRTGTAARRAAIGHAALAWGVILVVLNLRLDVWLAVRREMSLAEMHRLLPPWLIPVLTLTLMTWIGILLAMTKPKLSVSRHAGGGNGRGSNVKVFLLLMLLVGMFSDVHLSNDGAEPDAVGREPDASRGREYRISLSRYTGNWMKLSAKKHSPILSRKGMPDPWSLPTSVWHGACSILRHPIPHAGRICLPR